MPADSPFPFDGFIAELLPTAVAYYLPPEEIAALVKLTMAGERGDRTLAPAAPLGVQLIPSRLVRAVKFSNGAFYPLEPGGYQILTRQASEQSVG